MNSYAIGISGSWWLVLLFIAIAAAFTIFTYKQTIPPVSSLKRIILISLRTIALSILLFILFEPVISVVSGTMLKPKLAVLLDNSTSAATEDNSGNRLEAFKAAIENSAFTSLSDDEYIVNSFGESVREIDNFHTDSLKFDEAQTDISIGIKHATRKIEKENVQAILLITDGAFNQGNNPIYAADYFGKPVFTIGIGDSTAPKDMAIQSILTNDIVYFDNPVPVNVNIKSSGYTEGEFTLTLKDNGEEIETQTFNVHPDRETVTSVFEFNPKTEGSHKITAVLSRFDDEITYKNNIAVEFVNVLKNKKQICLFAGAPSSDVSFIRAALEAEKGTEVKTFIQKKGAEFYSGMPTAEELRKSELLILIGFPLSTTAPAVLDMIENELKRGLPVLFVASRDLDYNRLRQLENYLPFNTLSTNLREFSALPELKAKALSSPILRIHGTENDLDYWNQLPPIFRTETFVKPKPESEILSKIKVNNVALNEPLIMTRSIQNKKSVAVLGYGLYRWKLLGHASDVSKGQKDSPDLFNIFINNSVKWLTVNRNNKLVDIKTTKKLYTVNENVEFIAQVYDAAYTPIDNASIRVELTGSGETREFILNDLGNGRYGSSIDGLGKGDWAFKGTATVNGRNVGSDKGGFNIGEVAIEYQNLQMQADLLRNIANRTGGKFYLPESSEIFISDLESLPGFKDRTISNRSEFSLWNFSWLLFIVVLCFAVEWFLRKRAGMI
ncbi:MAG: VWA domain-containing protein [Chlorobi bacterium]|nr:VWA domain-containing protein [Chlorobiota bacterium]